MILLRGECVVNVEQRGDALRNGFCVQHTHVTVGQGIDLFCRHDNIFVVGENIDMLCGGRKNRLEQIVGARVHRLSAADYLIRAELGEQLAQTLAGRDRDIAERLCRLDRLHRLGLILGRRTP